MNNFECKPVMANLQESQLGIHGEESWWQLFDLICNVIVHITIIILILAARLCPVQHLLPVPIT